MALPQHVLAPAGPFQGLHECDLARNLRDVDVAATLGQVNHLERGREGWRGAGGKVCTGRGGREQAEPLPNAWVFLNLNLNVL